jgi:hypothetical protein
MKKLKYLQVYMLVRCKKNMSSSGITPMIKDLIILAILSPIALQLLASANWTGINPTVVNILTVVVPIIFGVAAALKWLGRI